MFALQTLGILQDDNARPVQIPAVVPELSRGRVEISRAPETGERDTRREQENGALFGCCYPSPEQMQLTPAKCARFRVVAVEVDRCTPNRQHAPNLRNLTAIRQRTGAARESGTDGTPEQARNVSRYWLSQNWKMSQQRLSQMKFFIPLCYPTVPAFCGVDSNATTPQIIAAFRVKFRLNRQKLAKNKNTITATR